MPEPLLLVTAAACLAIGGVAGWLWARQAHRAESSRQRLALQRALDEARIDPLTGVWNRKAFDENLPIQAAISRRYGTPLALVLVDADDLKAVNDRYGHVAGDEVLRRLARLLRESLREADLLMRLGGDEFALLLPQTDLQGATAAAARIVASSNERGAIPFSSPLEAGAAATLELRASLGVAELEPDEPPSELVKRADQALYRAKRSGGNCWFVADPSTVPATGRSGSSSRPDAGRELRPE
jgi:diguanylate cyclase (GGDEF)-like protein